MFSQTVTIFNDLRGIWYPTVLHHAQVTQDRGYILRNYGATSNDTVAIHLPVQEGKIEGKLYVGPKEYEQLADGSSAMTLRGGERFDIVALGEWTGGPVRDDDYTGGFYQAQRKQRDDVWAINSVSGPYTTIPHFEITGR